MPGRLQPGNAPADRTIGDPLLAGRVQPALSSEGPGARAATLKGLVIHTADECGVADGPDYQFGWGLANNGSGVFNVTDMLPTGGDMPLALDPEDTDNDGCPDIVGINRFVFSAEGIRSAEIGPISLIMILKSREKSFADWDCPSKFAR